MACVEREEGLVMFCDAARLGGSNSSRLAARFQTGIRHRASGQRDYLLSHEVPSLRYWIRRRL
jgi:hypothetical protein